jgi:hypothetical protein
MFVKFKKRFGKKDAKRGQIYLMTAMTQPPREGRIYGTILNRFGQVLPWKGSGDPAVYRKGGAGCGGLVTREEDNDISHMLCQDASLE